MEVMDISLAKFYPRVFNSGQLMPHDFLGVVSVSVSVGLFFHSLGILNLLRNTADEESNYCFYEFSWA